METSGCLWPWSISRSFTSNICLSLSDVSWHRLSRHFTKKNVIVLLPLSIIQSNHSLPTSSPLVQVAQLWAETEAPLASINVLISTLMWCSPDNKEVCAHQSAGKWRHEQSAQAAWVLSIPRWASDISVSNKCYSCVIIGEKQRREAEAGSAWLEIKQATKHSDSLLAALSSHDVIYRLDCDLNIWHWFFSPPPLSLSLLLYRAQWLIVQGETALSMLKTSVCPPSPIWMAQYYVGCLAACTERQEQLSHLLHSIFICQHASGEARGDLDPPRRSIFVQQVKLRSKKTSKTDLIYTQVRTKPHPSLGREEYINTRMQSGATENWRRLLLSHHLKWP